MPSSSQLPKSITTDELNYFLSQFPQDDKDAYVHPTVVFRAFEPSLLAVSARSQTPLDAGELTADTHGIRISQICMRKSNYYFYY